jgi:perosamine synthetase
MITIYDPEIGKYTKSAIEAIHSGWISNIGEFVEKSTNKLKEILNCEYAILMANGTCATHCLFLALHYKYPDIKKIYVPNNSYVAAWNTALMVYNIDQLSVMKMDNNKWNINTDEEYIKSLDADSAVLIVHNLGNIINVPRLKRIRPDLIFIEDNCEGLFGKYNSIYSGTSTDILCSSASFYGNKIITSGEGGVFMTQHKDIYDHIKKVYSQGMSSTRYLHDVHAYNYRMTNVQAAFIYDQLHDLSNIIAKKINIFANYETLLDGLIKTNKIKLFEKECNTENAHWMFAVRILGNTKTIEETIYYFRENGVDIRPFFYPIHKHGHLATIENNDVISDLLNQEIIMIPSSPNITMEEQQKVIDVLYKYILENENIIPIEINDNTIHLLNVFIPKVKSTHFRYFNKRTSDSIKSHIITLLFYNMITNEYFGYTHVDYDETTNKYWFGIYLHDTYRGNGHGATMLNYTLQHKNVKGTEIHLSVDNDNIYALKLYEKYDFVIYNSDEKIHYMKKIL